MINLLPIEEKDKNRSDYHRRVLSVCLPLSAGVLFVAIVSLSPAYFFSVRSYEKILKESQSAEVVSKKTQEAEMRSTVRKANEKILLLKKPTAKSGAWDIWNEILKKRVPGVSITGFSYDSETISSAGQRSKELVTGASIQGVSESREKILAFVNNLKNNANFKSVDLPISSLVSGTDFYYSINIVLNE